MSTDCPPFLPLDDDDRKLIAAAAEVLAERYDADKQTVAAAVLCDSGRIYTGVNLDSSGRGPCAEPVAIGAAVTAGDTAIRKVVAVCKCGPKYEVLSPCGNCRQIMLDYAPDAMVILADDAQPVKAPARALLPGPYTG
ncbi:MAG: cytidine deaminase [Phycisphaerae bacterium]|nr:cytidine deaminase [Phycisphaerae bacterium]